MLGLTCELCEAMRPREPRQSDRILSPDDQAQIEATAAAVKGMVENLKGLNIDRPIKTLNEVEMVGLATACISAWIVKRSQQEALAAVGGPIHNMFA